MEDRPQGLDDSAVAAGLAAGWGLRVRSLEYLPVGFGSYHWASVAGDGRKLFVKVDEGDFSSLRRAYGAAVELRERGGLEFVVAPLVAADGEPVRSLGPRYTLSVFPMLDGSAGEFGPHRPEDRDEVLGLLGRLHRADVGDVEPEDPGLPGRDHLEGALADLGGAWTTGPYAEPCRRLLADQAGVIAAWLADFDALATRTAGLPRVVTHGEPHPGNFLRTGSGLRLIDWETVRLAPPERDLWLVDGPGDPDGLAYFRLRWCLTDVADFVRVLREPHLATADTTAAWTHLGGYFTRSSRLGKS